MSDLNIFCAFAIVHIILEHLLSYFIFILSAYRGEWNFFSLSFGGLWLWTNIFSVKWDHCRIIDKPIFPWRDRSRPWLGWISKRQKSMDQEHNHGTMWWYQKYWWSVVQIWGKVGQGQGLEMLVHFCPEEWGQLWSCLRLKECYPL